MVAAVLGVGVALVWGLQMKRAAQNTVDTRVKALIRFGDKVIGKKPGSRQLGDGH